MRRQALRHVSRPCGQWREASARARRSVQISATPASTDPIQSLDSPSTADARFEVLGAPFSLLSASIAPSQNLYTRKGSLVGFTGKPENAVSTLSLLAPLQRALSGIPFIYQRITSTTPYTALIATKSHATSLVVVHLDGRLDWMVAQRNALLAWTGHTLALSPRWNLSMSTAYWGSTTVTGRGLLALSGKGLINQISLKAGEEYVVHPGNVLAYSMQHHAPQPYRFKASSLRLQIPNPLTWLPDTRFWRTMRETTVWRFFRSASFTSRTWARRTIWGDRLFLHFHGPATLLIQSRAAALSDVLTSQDVNELADSPAGSVASTLAASSAAAADPSAAGKAVEKKGPVSVSYATVSQEGSVRFDKT